MSNATGVRCRGTCKAGHTTEAAADPGRVTWHGECATEGCDLKVYCRRVPADTPAPPPDTRTAETDPHRVLEVPGYRDEPAPREPEQPAGDEPAESSAGGEPSAGGAEEPPAAARPRRKRTAGKRPSGAAPAPPVEPTPPRPERPRGVLGRLRARRDAGEHDTADEEQLFGYY